MANERRIVELVLKAIGDAEVKRMTAELVKMRGAAEQSQASLDSLEQMGFKLGRSLKTALGGIAAGLTFGAIVGQIESAVNAMDDLSVATSKVGVAAKDLQELRYAAALSNVDVETLDAGLGKLAKNMADLAGKGGPATKFLRELGVTASTGVVEAMEKVADQFAAMPDGAKKSALAIQEFGKSGAELIPILNAGGDGIRQMTKEAEDLGLVLSDQALVAANSFNDEMDRLKAISTAATQQIVAGMLPALLGLARAFVAGAKSAGGFYEVGQSIGEVMIWIAGNIAEVVTYLTKMGQSIYYLVRGVQAAESGFRESVLFNPEKAEQWYQTATNFFKAAQGYSDNAGAIAAGAKRAVDSSFAAVKTEIAAGKLATGGTEDGDIPGSGAKAAKAKAAKTVKDTTTKDFYDQLKQSLSGYTNAVSDNVKVTLDQRDAAAALAKQWNDAADPLRKYLAAQLDIAKARETGELTQAGETEAMRAANEEYERAKQTLLENSDAYKKLQALQEEQQRRLEQMRETWGFVADAAGQATDAIISHSESISQAIRRMVATIISELARLALQKLASKLISALFPAVTGSFSSSQLSQAATAPILGIPKLYASGGVIGAPTAFATPGGIGIAGEAGPEMIAPLKRDASGNLGVGATAPQVTVNNYAGADVQVRPTDQGLQIDILRRQIADDIRRGGNPVAHALEGTYKVGRYAGAYA